jgi:3-methyladenine DNA glycosylase AlkD
MKSPEVYVEVLRAHLVRVRSDEKAESSRRYFPAGAQCLGVNALDIKTIVADFQSDHRELGADETLLISEHLLENAKWHEDVLLAFGLMNKFVKNHYRDDLLLRFEYWLEHYASNWSHVDDLCIKTVYQFLLARPHLIESTQGWSYSKVPWCRRASNVVWVKFIKRKIGKTTYFLDKNLVFKNCDVLLEDEDEFVQKSVGWLLKVCSVHHEEDVIRYLQKNAGKLKRPTLRYAIEKMDAKTRRLLLS